MRFVYGLKSRAANQVWDLLVAEAAAAEHDRRAFVRYLCSPDNLNSWEYRFMGRLGFGGKLHYNSYRGAWVSCYPHDLTEEARRLVERLNEQLAVIAPGARGT